MESNRDRQFGIAVGLDVFSVVVFVAIGRRNHEESSAFVDIMRTGAPFLGGLALGWVVTKAWRRPMRIITGVVIWPITVLAGMILRRLVFDDGTATSFVIVATLFLGAMLVGWRVAVRQIMSRRRNSATA